MLNVTVYKEILGQTVTNIESDHEEITFDMADGSRYRMFHSQDCCECVTIEDVVGDINDLIGHPLVEAEEITFNHENELDPKTRMWNTLCSDESLNRSDESQTWTYYKFRTIKGSVSIRWYGSSNGYYSESVSFEKTN